MIPGFSPQVPFYAAKQVRQADAGNNPGQSSRTVLDSVHAPAASATTAQAVTGPEMVAEDTNAYGKSKQFPGFTPRNFSAPHTTYHHP